MRSKIIPQHQSGQFQSLQIEEFNPLGHEIFDDSKAVEESQSDQQDEAPVSKPETPQYSPEAIASIEKQAHDEAYQAGLEQGRETGYQQGLAKAETETGQLLSQFRQTLVDMNAAADSRDKQLDDELQKLILTMAERVIQRELTTDPEYVLTAVHKALAELPSQQRPLRVYLNSEEIGLVRQDLQLSDPEQPWQLIEDSTLSVGSCRVESGSAELDLDLDKRLTQVIDAVLGIGS